MSILALRDVRIPNGHAIRPTRRAAPRWLHHGSSNSQCIESARPLETWPVWVARRTGFEITNLGLAGQCQLDQFMARAIRDHPADVISLELGINVVNADSMRERVFLSALHGFLDTVREGHPETPVLIFSPFICPVAETHPGSTPYTADRKVYTLERPDELAQGALTLSRVRQLIAAEVTRRVYAGTSTCTSSTGSTYSDPRTRPTSQTVCIRTVPATFGSPSASQHKPPTCSLQALLHRTSRYRFSQGDVELR
ncbi:SGNH/GDSL hydrolase family protein [Arthrobacter sp. SD76]|uniref:SGNH/GDSL hydrolase family protein n=1 Tax=Arthrobacter sp. SD76 TaxID=3415007 RepID=UPI003C795742